MKAFATLSKTLDKTNGQNPYVVARLSFNLIRQFGVFLALGSAAINKAQGRRKSHKNILLFLKSSQY